MPSTDYEYDGRFQLWVVERDGTRIKELPAKGLEEMTWGLNGTHSMRFKIPTWDPRSTYVELVRREVMVVEGSKIIWWGVPWRISGNASSLSVECEGLMSYFGRRFITYTSLDYTSLEQRVIAWNLLNHTQILQDGDLNISAASFSGTTHIRSRRYERELHENILDLVNEFPTLENGFEFDIKFQPGLREWTPYYPRQGVDRPDMLLEWGRNIVNFTYNEDAMQIANHVYVTGGASGEVRFENNYRNNVAAAHWGLMQSVTSEGQTLDPDWLLDRAKREAQNRSTPVIMPELTVVDDPIKIFGVVGPGDRVPVRIDVGRIRFNAMFRIGQISWQKGNQVNLSFVEENA